MSRTTTRTAMKPGAPIVIRGTSYKVLHVVECSARTKAAGIARAFTVVKPEDGDDRSFMALQRRNGSIFGLTAVP